MKHATRTQTIPDAGKALGVSEGTIRKLIAAGALQAVDLSAPNAERRTIRVLTESIEALLTAGAAKMKDTRKATSARAAGDRS